MAQNVTAQESDGAAAVVLLALGAAEPGDALVAGVGALRRAGVRVHLVSRRPPSALLREVLTSTTVDNGTRDSEPSDRVLAMPAGRLTPGADRLDGRLGGRPIALPGPLPAIRLDPDRLPSAVRLLRHPATRSLVAAADGVVAVDQAAIPAAWLAGRRHRHLVALNGLPAAVQRWASRA